MIPGSEEDYALNLASAFINPDVFYVNNRIMCCKDRYPNGQCIENRLNSRSFDECEQAYRRMSAMQDLIDVMREYTKNKVSGPYSYYNDELHSFVAKFDPDDIVDRDEVGVKIKTLIARMNALKACLETDLFDIAPLDSIRVSGRISTGRCAMRMTFSVVRRIGVRSIANISTMCGMRK